MSERRGKKTKEVRKDVPLQTTYETPIDEAAPTPRNLCGREREQRKA
jgi:hypothetical protein